MLHLNTFVHPEASGAVCDELASFPGVRHVTVGSTTTDGLVTFVIKPVKEVTFQDQAATEIKLQFKAPT